MQIRITRNQLDDINRRARDIMANALEDVAEDCLRESNKTVPLDEGPLERSGFVQVDREKLSMQIAYDTPYAVRQHEDLTLSHAPGRRAKFLERAIEENRARYVKHIQEELRRGLSG